MRKWQQGGLRVNSICVKRCDCIDGMRSLPLESIDAVITSPPYYNAREYSHYGSYEEYLNWMREVVKGIHRVLKRGRVFALNVSCVLQPRLCRSDNSRRFAIPYHMVGICEEEGFEFRDDIIWEKTEGAVPNRGQKFAHLRTPILYRANNITEFVLIFVKKGKSTDDVLKMMPKDVKNESKVEGHYERANVWRFNPETKSSHPAPFPIYLPHELCRYYTFRGDLVLDPFCGSGTTGIACKRTGRRFIGFEKCAEYADLAQRRIDSELSLY